MRSAIRRTLVAVTSTAILAVAAVIAAQPARTAVPHETTAATTNVWPGPDSKSGVNANDESISPDSVNAFCSWRGRACEVTVTPTTRTNWDTMTGTGGAWLFDRFAGWPGQLVISEGLLPNDHAGQLTECANGDFNQNWQNFGTLLTEKGRGNSIVRLGWEFNGDWTNWEATDTQAWIGCYRNAAQNIRVTDPDVILDWTIGAHWHSSSICGGVSTNCYPGDDVVDIIGIDNYDMGPSASTLDEFNQIANAQEGLTWLYNFAVAHGKPFSVGEWGIAPGSADNDTGENPPFIQWMHDWFVAHAGNLAYEAYFNTCTPGDVESNLFRPVSDADNCVRLNSNAGQLYQSLFGSTLGDAHGGSWALRQDATGTPSMTGAFQTVNVATDSNYNFSAWVKGDGQQGKLVVYNSTWQVITESTPYTSSGTWTQVSTPSFNTGANSTLIVQFIDLGTAVGTTYLDDAFLGVSGGVNTLTNPGFESGDTGWTMAAPFTTQHVVTAHGGSWVLRQLNSGTPSMTGAFQTVNVATNSNYNFSAWVKGDGQQGKLVVYNSTWQVITESTPYTSSGTWTQVSTPSFNTGANSTLIVQFIDLGTAAGTTYLDDAFLGVSGGANTLTNPGFESGDTGWTMAAPFSVDQL